MKHELVKWLCIGLDNGMIMGLNLGSPTSNFLFARIMLAWIWKAIKL